MFNLKALLTVLILILGANSFLLAQKHTISGYIKDKGSGESLIAANVFNKSDLKGTTTNTFGFYSLTLPQDSITLVVSYVGYTSVVSTFYLDKNIELNIDLASAIELDEIVITAEEEIQQQTQMSAITVKVKDIQALPALMGEVDVLKVLQLLPGVQSGSEGSSGLYVRGGGPDQNLILLDGVPIYNSSHLFGFFSVFNADAINNVELIKGGFPARYGGRLSSVIDISLKEGNVKEFKGTATIGLIASKITLEAPIIKDKTSFLFSARRTYIDILTRPIIKAQSGGDVTAGYFFYDLNAKINHKFSNKDRLYISGFLGKDKAYSRNKYNHSFNGRTVDSKEEFGLNWGNAIGAIRWNHVFTPKLFSNLTLTYSRYNFAVFNKIETITTDASGTTDELFAIQYLSGIEDFAAKIDFDFIPNPNHYIRFGINTIHHEFNPGVLSYESVEIDTVVGSFETRAIEFAAYIEDDFSLTDNLKINAGLHFSGFNVENTTYTSLQPRIALRYLVNNSLSIKASYAQMAQFIHLLSNSGIGLPTDLWLPSTDRVKPQTSFQYALGVAKTFNKSYELSVEGYYKEMDNLIEYKDGASFTSINKDWQDKIESGKGTSYGAEVLFQKKLGKLTGWVGYTLSWTDRQFENINFGEAFPYRYDRRHDISVTSIYKINDHIQLAAVWVYGTGNSVSLPTNTYLKNNSVQDGYSGNDVQYFDGRNGFRMDAYHRLDASIAWTKVKKNGIRKFTLGFYNMYNRRNPFFIQQGYDYRTNQKKFVQYSLMPIIPSISYRFDF